MSTVGNWSHQDTYTGIDWCNNQTLRQAGPTDAESDTGVKGVTEPFIQSTGQYQKILSIQAEVPKR